MHISTVTAKSLLVNMLLLYLCEGRFECLCFFLSLIRRLEAKSMQTVKSPCRDRDRESGLGPGRSGDIWSSDCIPNITVCEATAAVCPKAGGLYSMSQCEGMDKSRGYIRQM